MSFKPILTNWIPIQPGEFYYGDKTKVLTRVNVGFEIADILVTEYNYNNKINSNKPKVNINYNECQKYCLKLSKQDPKYNYRLPYSYEWEYVMRNRGKANGVFFDRNDENELNKYAVYNTDKITNVKTKLPRLIDNKYPIYDMEGLIWEWTNSYYNGNDYLPIDKYGNYTDSGRVIRGGGWGNFARFLRSGIRYGYSPGGRYYVVGFRLVRTLK